MYICYDYYIDEVALTALRIIALCLTSKNRNIKLQREEADMDIPFILSQNIVSWLLFTRIIRFFNFFQIERERSGRKLHWKSSTNFMLCWCRWWYSTSLHCSCWEGIIPAVFQHSQCLVHAFFHPLYIQYGVLCKSKRILLVSWRPVFQHQGRRNDIQC